MVLYLHDLQQSKSDKEEKISDIKVTTSSLKTPIWRISLVNGCFSVQNK